MYIYSTKSTDENQVIFYVHMKNTIAEYEGFYPSVIYAYFYSLGIELSSYVSSISDFGLGHILGHTDFR